MDHLDKKRLTMGAAVCMFVIIVVVALQHSSLSRMFTFAPEEAHSATTTAPHAASSTVTSVDGKLNINTASAEDLTTLKGVGEAKAEAIVKYREAHGSFYHIEDITNVAGIGTAMFAHFKDDITVGDVVPAGTAHAAESNVRSTAPAAVEVALAAPAHIRISAVSVGEKGSANDEYIELYNAGSAPVDLTTWSIKKKSASGSESTLVSATRLRGKHISPGAYFLLVNESGYRGADLPDGTWPSSYTLSSKNNALTLYRGTTPVDSVAWNDIPEGKEYVRASMSGADFVVAAHTPQGAAK